MSKAALDKKEFIFDKYLDYREINLLFYLGLIPIVIVINLFFADVAGIEYAVSLLVSISYIFSFYLICKYKGSCSIANLFWLCLGIFGVFRFVLYALNLFDFTGYAFSIYLVFKWERNTVVTVASYYLVFMAVFSTITLIGTGKNKITETYDHTASTFSYIQKPTYIIFYALAPYTAYMYYRQARTVMQIGYTSIYNGELSAALSTGLLPKLAMLVFTLAFYTIVCFERRVSYFDAAAICFLCVNAIPLLQGSRAVFITNIMTIVFLRYALFNKEIPFKWIVAGCVVCIPGLVLVSYIRNGVSITEIRLVDTYKKFIVDLSGSLNVTAYYLQNKNSLPDNTYPYIFEPIVRIVQYFSNIQIFKQGQSLDMAAIRYNLGHQLSFFISKNYYLNGSNVASNFIAEMSEFGFAGVVVFSAVISKLVDFVERCIINRNPFFLFMSVEFCFKIFMLPRSEAFYDTYNLAKYGLFFIMLFTVANLLEGRTLADKPALARRLSLQ